MSLIEKTKYYYSEKNKNCAEAILLASNEVFEFGLSEDCAKIVKYLAFSQNKRTTYLHF